MAIIEFKNIRKTFNQGRLVANDNISLKVEEGSIHAIIGENGAGKTTLLSILFGIIQPDSGEIIINNKKVNFRKASDARKMKLGMVYQHFQLIDSFSILDNIFLGNEESKFGVLTKKRALTKINDLSTKYKFNLSAKSKVKNLTVGQKQKVEILKLLYGDSEILILDEPTAMLSPSEITELLNVIKILKKQGKTIIFISHKLHEVKRIADEGTVIRKGKVIKNFDVSKTSTDQMASWMVGKKVVSNTRKLAKNISKEDLLTIKNLSTKKINGKGLDDINLKVRKGEIIGIAGVEGNGQVPLIENITGLGNNITKGLIVLNNQKLNNLSVRKRYEAGLSHIPEDRLRFGMIKQLHSYENITLRQFMKRPFSKNGIMRTNKMKKYAQNIIERHDIRGANLGQTLGVSLSGGNQQKLVVGREIEINADLIIAFQPTRGVDIGAVNNIHESLTKEVDKGKGLLLVSYDLDELLKLSDKIAVMSEGKISGIVDNNKKINKEKLGLLMAGRS